MSFVTVKTETLAFLGWPYYILERLTILYAMFIFIGFHFSLMKGIYNTCATQTQVNRQASVARVLFAGIFGIFLTSINKILLDAQIKDYNRKTINKTKCICSITRQYKRITHSTPITKFTSHPSIIISITKL